MTQKTQAEQLELLRLLEQKEQEVKYNKINTYFPDTGPYRRELYHKHIAFLDAGAQYNQRAIIAANRVGKSVLGAYEVTCHATGIYPKWWKGKKFTSPCEIWAVGISNQATKEVSQKELLGPPYDIGSGMIPKHLIRSTTKKPGVADAIETVLVEHISGGCSEITFKSYEQGRESFQGTKKQLIWLDEEPKDRGIYSECLTRLFDPIKPGTLICTFTPLLGLTDLVMDFMPGGIVPYGGVNGFRHVTQVTWDDAPHISDQQKKEALASYSKHERDARSRGIPCLGSGAIYPYSEEDIVVEPFHVPPYWPRAYGLDVGWKITAAVWGALDPDSRVLYIYSEHYQGESHPAVHASAIRARGAWIHGAIDPASAGVNQVDGRALFDLYEQEGLILEKADNSVEAGIVRVGQMFESGLLKIFSNLKETLTELRVYRRDEKGRLIKKNDHAMDALRYLCMTGIEFATTSVEFSGNHEQNNGVSGKRDEFTGY